MSVVINYRHPGPRHSSKVFEGIRGVLFLKANLECVSISKPRKGRVGARIK